MTTYLARISPSLRRYLIIGISVYIFELFVIALAQKAGSSPVVAVSLSFWLGLVVSYLMQKIITFEDRRTEKRIVGRQLLLFSGLVLWNFSFTVLLTHMLQHHIPSVLCRTLALGITTIWNFYLYKTHIFTPSR